MWCQRIFNSGNSKGHLFQGRAQGLSRWLSFSSEYSKVVKGRIYGFWISRVGYLVLVSIWRQLNTEKNFPVQKE